MHGEEKVYTTMTGCIDAYMHDRSMKDDEGRMRMCMYVRMRMRMCMCMYVRMRMRMRTYLSLIHI